MEDNKELEQNSNDFNFVKDLNNSAEDIFLDETVENIKNLDISKKIDARIKCGARIMIIGKTANYIDNNFMVA